MRIHILSIIITLIRYLIKFLNPLVIYVFFIFIYNIFYVDPDYCTDHERTLQSMREELEYWQSDLEGLTHLYKSNGYDTLNPNQLTEQQSTEKAILEESIKDGRKNVKTSIETIRNLKENINQSYNQSESSSSSLGKRVNENSQVEPNKRQS